MSVPILTQQVRAALQAGHLAHLVTLNEDGSPRSIARSVEVGGSSVQRSFARPSRSPNGQRMQCPEWEPSDEARLPKHDAASTAG